MATKDRFCARCGQKAVKQQVTEDGKSYDVFTCLSHKEVVWKELSEEQPEAAAEGEAQGQVEGGEPASSSVEPAAAPQKREPKALN